LPQTHRLGDWHRNSEPRIAIGGGPRVGSAAELKMKTAAGVSYYNGLPLCRNRNVAHSRSVRPVRSSLPAAREHKLPGRLPAFSALYRRLRHPKMPAGSGARSSGTGWYRAGGTLNVQQRQLGRDGPSVPVIGFGAWPIGGGLGAVDDRDAIRTLHHAFEQGVTLVDTAEAYRTSEELVGRALATWSGPPRSNFRGDKGARRRPERKPHRRGRRTQLATARRGHHRSAAGAQLGCVPPDR